MEGLKPSHFITKYGGWHIDKKLSLGTGHTEGCWGALLPKPFVEAAKLAFPDKVRILTEAEWESFYNDRFHAHEEDETLDVEVLQGLQARLALEADPTAPTVEPSAAIVALRTKMLDPKDKKRGIRENPRRYWARHKADRECVIDGTCAACSAGMSAAEKAADPVLGRIAK